MNCQCCSTCCAAPDISTLGKPLGVKCPHLNQDGLCSIYEDRPEVCRGYMPDEICGMVSAPTLPERVGKYLKLFGLA
jgi:uncharacterized protein